MSRPAVEVIHGPVITEKAYSLYQDGRYTFRVSKDATKQQISEALEDHYKDQGIKVIRVNTISMHGKVRRTGRRGVSGRTPSWKKAIVTLAPGQKLEGLFGSL